MLFRTSMNNEENKDMIQSLLQLGFSKDKIIIHSDVTLLEDLHLKRIHFKEMTQLLSHIKKLILIFV